MLFENNYLETFYIITFINVILIKNTDCKYY